MGSLIKIAGIRPTQIGDKFTWSTGKQRARFQTLKVFEEAGEIEQLTVFSKWPLSFNGVSFGNLECLFDYKEKNKGVWVVEFIASREEESAVKTLKKKIFKACYPLVELREIQV
jgi:hypothetical protein